MNEQWRDRYPFVAGVAFVIGIAIAAAILLPVIVVVINHIGPLYGIYFHWFVS